jgi:hypothetical protein
VACDALVCTELARGGFTLNPLGPGSWDPLGSTLVVATGDIQAHFGHRLASVYAPVLVASFGSGSARIDIRWLYPGGSDKYYDNERSLLRARKVADAQLLTNDNITLPAAAKAKLLSGAVDPRLPQLIAALAYVHPLRIVDFVDQSPGGGPASLLRTVDLATAENGSHLAPAAYAGWIRGYTNGQRSQYRPAWSQLTLPNGQTVLRIGYRAPSPLSPNQASAPVTGF